MRLLWKNWIVFYRKMLSRENGGGVAVAVVMSEVWYQNWHHSCKKNFCKSGNQQNCNLTTWDIQSCHFYKIVNQQNSWSYDDAITTEDSKEKRWQQARERVQRYRRRLTAQQWVKDDRKQLVCQHLSDSLHLLTCEYVFGVRHMIHICIPSNGSYKWETINTGPRTWDPGPEDPESWGLCCIVAVKTQLYRISVSLVQA